jgi:SAM-dependent methyltransferase
MPRSGSYGSSQWFHRAYARVADDPWGLSWRTSQRLRRLRVLALVRTLPSPPVSAIDVGCSTGDFTRLLTTGVPTLKTLLGVDFADHAIRRARLRYPEIPFLQESILTVGDRHPGRFDLAACLETLYDLDRAEQLHALTPLRRLLRPRGHAVLSSYISAPPYFTPRAFRELTETTFDVVASDIVHLTPVSLVERLASRSDRFPRRLARRPPTRSAPALDRLPLSAVSPIEAASRPLSPLTASHTIVLARARD